VKNRPDVLVNDCIPDYCKSRVLVLGCGNILFGDDGFGPSVIEYLEKHHVIPDDVCILDVGTGVRDLLCTVALSPVKPQRIVVIDAVDRGVKPGEVFVGSIEGVLATAGGNFSLHQLPTSTLLRELKNYCHIDIVLISVQPESTPEVVCPGLSKKVRAAVAPACQYLLKTYL